MAVHPVLAASIDCLEKDAIQMGNTMKHIDTRRKANVRITERDTAVWTHAIRRKVCVERVLRVQKDTYSYIMFRMLKIYEQAARRKASRFHSHPSMNGCL